MNGFYNPVTGSEDTTLYSVGSGSSLSNWEDTLSFTKTYLVNGTSFTISNDPHAAPTDGSTAYNVNANSGAFSTISNGNVNIGPIQALGTIGNDPIGPMTPSAPTSNQSDGTAMTPEQQAALAMQWAVSDQTRNNANPQQLFNGFSSNLNTSGMANTLSAGAVMGEIATAGGVALPVLAVVGAPAAASMYVTGATAALAAGSTPTGQGLIEMGGDFVDGWWNKSGVFPPGSWAGIAGGLVGDREKIHEIYDRATDDN
jgi:hypothetical protein